MKMLRIGLVALLAITSLAALTIFTGKPPVWAQQTQQGNRAIAASQVTVAATATLISGTKPTRGSIIITNAGTTAVYIGNSDVTALTGALLPGVVGATVTIPSTASIYGITAAGTQAVTVLEAY